MAHPLPEAQHTFYIDGSSISKPPGPRRAAYAIVSDTQVIEANSLPLGTTSQQAELVALTRALIWAKNKTVNIYTDSKYAFLIAHSYCMIWKERDFLTTKGTPVLNGTLISRLIQAIQLPLRVAIMHCKGHQTSNSPVAKGNAFTDETARPIARAHPTSANMLSFKNIQTTIFLHRTRPFSIFPGNPAQGWMGIQGQPPHPPRFSEIPDNL
ncbi:ribonuclease H-like [Molossus molossus]|uniref:ribonuclease H-like n=1 Tax=Molossus molossus TaxID=27622 RepID=UPI0017472241|nr:ribonuclease H-like [Molossus molossus]